MDTIIEIKKTEKLKELKVDAEVEGLPKAPSSGGGLGEAVSGSVAVLEIFIAEKVDTIFGYPGGAIMPVYDAL